MAALHSRCRHYIFTPFLLLSSSTCFPCLMSAIADWMSTILPQCPHFSANLGCRSETCCTRLAENTGCKNDAKNRHLGTITTLLGYIYATKARIDSRKKCVKQQYLLHMSSQYVKLRPLAAEIISLVWGNPANFNDFMAVLLHGILVLGISQTLWR